ncbi:MAG: NAD(P)-binding protein [Candidatus Poseidoniales archaeon]|jgi:flavin-dependent dehydrogenase|tara:strand:- start:4334 stop:5560 length:1227 start_codon:yes stop_codon:yes gene_type:complete
MGDNSLHILGAGLSGLAAATILANAGKEVHVYDIRKDSGSRFDGDFQGIENWTSSPDFFDEMRSWGLNPESFKSNDFSVVDLAHPDDVITQPITESIAFRVVERGTDEHCIDQGMKRMALDAGVNIHYEIRKPPEECNIIAAGPKESSAVAFGEIFHTDHPNHVTLQLNDKLAPGAYSYLIIIDGIGLICTCLWRQQKKSGKYLNETIAWYESKYELNRRPIKRVGGKGDFSLPKKYIHEGRYYVGEAGGLQDFMWGFGMRYAITSGVLAAKGILGECDYEIEIRRRLIPLVKSSATNRFLLNRVGDRGFKLAARYWMWDQKRKGDGLAFLRWLYSPGIFRKLLWPFVKFGMLRKKQLSDGRMVNRMPFRKALKRDSWEPSARGLEIGKQWDVVRKSGAKLSFKESDA